MEASLANVLSEVFFHTGINVSCASVPLFENFFTVACLTQGLSKALGYLLVVGSLSLKVPQILKILAASSSEGISISSYGLELIGYTISFAYGWQLAFPFSTYGETLIVLLQDFVVVFLIALYSRKLLTPSFALCSILYAVACYPLLLPGFISVNTFAILQTATIPIFTFSKIPQIWINFQSKSTGQLALFTIAMCFFGSLARVFTTLVELDDLIVLSTFILGAFLNGIVLAQILLYWENTNAVVVRAKKEQ